MTKNFTVFFDDVPMFFSLVFSISPKYCKVTLPVIPANLKSPYVTQTKQPSVHRSISSRPGTTHHHTPPIHIISITDATISNRDWLEVYACCNNYQKLVMVVTSAITSLTRPYLVQLFLEGMFLRVDGWHSIHQIITQDAEYAQSCRHFRKHQEDSVLSAQP